jgi:hypothetical protein
VRTRNLNERKKKPDDSRGVRVDLSLVAVEDMESKPDQGKKNKKKEKRQRQKQNRKNREQQQQQQGQRNLARSRHGDSEDDDDLEGVRLLCVCCVVSVWYGFIRPAHREWTNIRAEQRE